MYLFKLLNVFVHLENKFGRGLDLLLSNFDASFSAHFLPNCKSAQGLAGWITAAASTFWALMKVEKLLNKAQLKQSVLHSTAWTYRSPPPIVRATDYDQTHSGHRQLAKNGAACCWVAINFGRQLLLSKGAALTSLSCPQLSLSGDFWEFFKS